MQAPHSSKTLFPSFSLPLTEACASPHQTTLRKAKTGVPLSLLLSKILFYSHKNVFLPLSGMHLHPSNFTAMQLLQENPCTDGMTFCIFSFHLTFAHSIHIVLSVHSTVPFILSLITEDFLCGCYSRLMTSTEPHLSSYIFPNLKHLGAEALLCKHKTITIIIIRICFTLTPTSRQINHILRKNLYDRTFPKRKK